MDIFTAPIITELILTKDVMVWQHSKILTVRLAGNRAAIFCHFGLCFVSLILQESEILQESRTSVLLRYNPD